MKTKLLYEEAKITKKMFGKIGRKVNPFSLRGIDSTQAEILDVPYFET